MVVLVVVLVLALVLILAVVFLVFIGEGVGVGFYIVSLYCLYASLVFPADPLYPSLPLPVPFPVLSRSIYLVLPSGA